MTCTFVSGVNQYSVNQRPVGKQLSLVERDRKIMAAIMDFRQLKEKDERPVGKQSCLVEMDMFKEMSKIKAAIKDLQQHKEKDEVLAKELRKKVKQLRSDLKERSFARMASQGIVGFIQDNVGELQLVAEVRQTRAELSKLTSGELRRANEQELKLNQELQDSKAKLKTQLIRRVGEIGDAINPWTIGFRLGMWIGKTVEANVEEVGLIKQILKVRTALKAFKVKDPIKENFVKEQQKKLQSQLEQVKKDLQALCKKTDNVAHQKLCQEKMQIKLELKNLKKQSIYKDLTVDEEIEEMNEQMELMILKIKLREQILGRIEALGPVSLNQFKPSPVSGAYYGVRALVNYKISGNFGPAPSFKFGPAFMIPNLIGNIVALRHFY